MSKPLSTRLFEAILAMSPEDYRRHCLLMQDCEAIIKAYAQSTNEPEDEDDVPELVEPFTASIKPSSTKK